MKIISHYASPSPVHNVPMEYTFHSSLSRNAWTSYRSTAAFLTFFTYTQIQPIVFNSFFVSILIVLHISHLCLP